MSPIKDVQVLRAIEVQATRWFVRHREGDLLAQEREDFMSWLRSSPQHVDAYLALVDLSGKMKVGVHELNLEADPLYERARQAIARSRNVVALSPRESVIEQDVAVLANVRKRWPLMVASIALLAVLASAMYVYSAHTQTIVVPHGEQRSLKLADGSVAYANSDAQLKIRYGEKQRVIELKSGQALFDVSTDPTRPFIVKVGKMDIVAVGTQFEVDRQADLITVTVVEGRINVLEREGANPQTLDLSAGQRVKLGRHSSRQRLSVDAQRATAWAHRQIIFAGRPLGEVVAEFNRNTQHPIVIEDEALRDYRIRGIFLTYDLDSFVAYLEDLDNIDVERTAEAIHVKPRKK